MIPVDFHAHSHFSCCGLHSFIELLTIAKSRNMTALTISDHGPTLGGRMIRVFYERLHQPVEGVQLLKGIECNIIDAQGAIDLPVEILPWCDIVLVGIHPNIETGLGKAVYTDLLVATIENNPLVDIITHPNSVEYPVDYPTVVRAAKRCDTAVEINNSKTLLQRVDDSETIALIEACASEGCPTAVNSDAHTADEVGADEAVRPLLARCGFPEELIVNRTPEAGLRFVDERRRAKAALRAGVGVGTD